MYTPDKVIIDIESVFYLEQFYSCLTSSSVFHKLCFNLPKMRQIIDSLVYYTINAIGSPQDLCGSSGDSSYLCVTKRNVIPLKSRVEFFSLVLGKGLQK
jgi:hypothetical protein